MLYVFPRRVFNYTIHVYIHRHMHINNAVGVQHVFPHHFQCYFKPHTFKRVYNVCLCTSLSLSPSPLVLIRTALYLSPRALCPEVIECVLAAYPCNYSLLSRAIQHTQHSAQIDVVQYPTALF